MDAIQREDESEIVRLEKLVNRVTIPALRPSALWYARQGWPVFPLAPNSKVPATQHGVKDATTNKEQIVNWWSQADYNIGLATGVMFDVIDVDGEVGIQSFAALPEEVVPTVHGRVSTPRGFHLYVPVNEQSGNKAGIRPGIDYRGKGGYVVSPPSQLDLKHYSWTIQPSPEIRN